MERVRLSTHLTTLGILLFALALVACGGAAKPTDTVAPAANTIPDSFVGAVPGTDAFLALTTTNGSSLSYACDSKQVATWFSGPVTNNAIDLKAANGDTLKATLAASGATGTLTLSGKALPFAIGPATGDTGLYRADQDANGGKVVGGWIVNGDGQQRGAVRNTSPQGRDEIQAAPPVVVAQNASATTQPVQTANFGPLTPRKLAGPPRTPTAPTVHPPTAVTTPKP